MKSLKAKCIKIFSSIICNYQSRHQSAYLHLLIFLCLIINKRWPNKMYYNYKLAAKCSKNDDSKKHTSTHLYKPILTFFFSHCFFDWFWPLLHYLLVSGINIVNIWKTGNQNLFKLLIFKDQDFETGFWIPVFSYWIFSDWELADNAKFVHMWVRPCGIIWFKRQHRTEEKKKIDDLKCSPGSDIKSQDLFNNVLLGHCQSRFIILTYFARSNIQMR